MAHVRGWERLVDALERVTAATGISEDETQQDICGAIADREIRIRFRIAKEDAFPRGFVEGTVRNGEEVDIPINLKPSDFDWKNSRPFQPWPIHGDRRLAGLDLASMTRYSKSASRFRAKWHLEWIELFRADITRVLVANPSEATPAGKVAQAGTQQLIGRRRPSFDRAWRVIEELYPNGVPDQAIEPNVNLFRRVGTKLKDAKLPPVSDDTILRAAGRRK
jgi:hypothetical protein